MPVYQLYEDDISFPPPEDAIEEGLLAIGGDLRPERLMMAYASGIFPWFEEGEEIMWWSPDPRMVLMPEEFKLSKSLRQIIRRNTFEVSCDAAFQEVIQHCANVGRPDEGGTWITEEMISAYQRLHELGFAHSVECWQQGELVGGLYGISYGAAFFGESMFHLKSNASKVAFYYLCEVAKKLKFHFIDAQMHTSHLESLGARTMAREDFLRLLEKSNSVPSARGKWDLQDLLMR